MTTKLIINSDYSQIVSDNKNLITFLADNLKFRQKGYHFHPLYRSKKWDGFVKFFSDKTGKFLTGLLPEVLSVIKKYEEIPKLEVKYAHPELLRTEIDKNFVQTFMPESNIELTDYQVDLVNQALKYKRGIVHAPTGAGKSFILASIIKCITPGVKILVLQNKKDLAIQNHGELLRWKIDNVGTLWGNACDPNDITVATVQSADHLGDSLRHIQVLIVDEVHDMVSLQSKNIYKKLVNASVRIGLSATPFKHGETDKVHKFLVKGFFGPLFKTTTTETGLIKTADLQKIGKLSKSTCVFHKINEPNLQNELYMDTIDKGIVNNDIFHKKVFDICSGLSGRTLILVDRVAHGDNLKKLIPHAYWITGQDTNETRKQVVDMLQNSKHSCFAIATQQIFNTGINVRIHSLINAAGGQADHLIIQRMGRGLRTADDKDEVLYIDFLFENNPYLKKHSKKRIKILEKEGHKIEIKDYDTL